MKSFITYLGSILFIISLTSVNAQNKTGSSTPEEATYTQSNNNTSKQYTADYNLNLENDIKKKTDRIQSLYFFEQEVLDSYGGGTQVITKSLKRNIYKAGQKLIEFQRERIDGLYTNDLAQEAKYLEEIERIQDQLIYFSGKENTRQVEKKMKKLKKEEPLKALFFQKI